MKCELRNVKINTKLSEETTCFSATLYIDDKPAAECSNRGCGGSNNYRFSDNILRQQFEAYCLSLPPMASQHFADGMKMDAELFISELLSKYQLDKQLRGWCKKQTVFRLKGDKEGTWRTIKPNVGPPFTPEMKAHLQKTYGDKLEQIANESY